MDKTLAEIRGSLQQNMVIIGPIIYRVDKFTNIF